MSSSTNPISLLPSRTTSLLRSTLVIPSLPSVLVELVQNSLDANSTSIDLSFNLDTWSIKCSDNGHGLSLEDLRKVGGERYWTSKLSKEGMSGVETFGFRGEALASMADVGILEILTRCSGSDRRGLEGGESFELVMRDHQRYEGVAKIKRNSIGTTVWIRDIFYKWPVRRRPLSTPSARLSLIASFRQSLSTLTLLYPGVSFNLTDISDNTTPKRLLSVSRSKEGILGRWKQLWGRAGVEKAVEFADWDSDTKSLGAEGFWSTTASHSRSNQYVYVNSRPLAPCDIHKLINHLFSQSTFSRYAASHLIDTSANNTSTQEELAAVQNTKAIRKSPKKVSERYPIFVFNLKIDLEMVDVTLEPEKRVVQFQDPATVNNYVEKVVRSFLIGHGFSNAPPIPTTVSPSATQRSPQKSPSKSANSRLPLSALQKQRPLSDVQNRCLSVVPSEMRPSATISAYPEEPPSESAMGTSVPIKWIDPASLQTYYIDPRTGNSWRPSLVQANKLQGEGGCHSCSVHSAVKDQAGFVDRSSLTKRRRASSEEAGEAVPEWMVQTMESWKNPVFETAEPLLPTLPPVALDSGPLPSRTLSTSQGPSNFNPNILNRTQLKSVGAYFRATFTSAVGQLPADVRGLGQKYTKDSLRKAEFIAQVDKKFLLVRLNPSIPSDDDQKFTETLVMVDQHAADERIRVERFLSEFAGAVGRGEEVKVFTFEEPTSVLLSRTEVLELENRLGDFRQWGIGIQLTSEPTLLPREAVEPPSSDYVQIHITTVPCIISDRLRLEPRLLQELVRSYLAQLVDQPRRSARDGKKIQAWSTVVRRCPALLLDLVNSKACRGAIMFNDYLTPKQCCTLLTQLAETAFPFQCAHGRPSLVPLVNLAESPSKSPARLGVKGIDWEKLRR